VVHGTGCEPDRKDHAGRRFTEHPLPTPDAGPSFIVAGADGSLWLTENSGNGIGRITLSGEVVEYALPTAEAGPVGIAAGPASAVWFVEIMADRTYRHYRANQ
jgi:virginiamycin B lyase